MCNSSLNPAADDNLNLHWRSVVPDSPKLQGLAHQKDQACAPLPLAALHSSCLRPRLFACPAPAPALTHSTISSVLAVPLLTHASSPSPPPPTFLTRPVRLGRERSCSSTSDSVLHLSALPLTSPVRLRGGRPLPQPRASSTRQPPPPHQGRTSWLRQQDHAFLTSRHRQPPRWPHPPCQPTQRCQILSVMAARRDTPGNTLAIQVPCRYLPLPSTQRPMLHNQTP